MDRGNILQSSFLRYITARHVTACPADNHPYTVWSIMAFGSRFQHSNQCLCVGIIHDGLRAKGRSRILSRLFANKKWILDGDWVGRGRAVRLAEFWLKLTKKYCSDWIAEKKYQTSWIYAVDLRLHKAWSEIRPAVRSRGPRRCAVASPASPPCFNVDPTLLLVQESSQAACLRGPLSRNKATQRLRMP